MWWCSLRVYACGGVLYVCMHVVVLFTCVCMWWCCLHVYAWGGVVYMCMHEVVFFTCVCMWCCCYMCMHMVLLFTCVCLWWCCLHVFFFPFQHFQLLMQTFVLSRFEPSLVFLSQISAQAIVSMEHVVPSQNMLKAYVALTPCRYILETWFLVVCISVLRGWSQGSAHLCIPLSL